MPEKIPIQKVAYQAHSWKKERTIILQKERLFEKLLFTSMFIVTNMQEITGKTITEIYKGRGQMENYIKETKLGFFMDKTDSSQFLINEAQMVIAMLSYNITQMMKLLVLPDKVTYLDRLH